MQITDVRVKLVNSENGKLKAIVSVTFDGCFVVHDIKVLEREKDSYFISMPSVKLRNGEYRDVAHPVNRETRDVMEETVINRYLEEIAKIKEEAENGASEDTVA